MIDVALPTDQGTPVLVRSFAACLASVTEMPIARIPQPRAGMTDALGQWRSWLAGRGAGLVPIANPARFNWPGYWIAILGEETAEAGSAQDRTVVLMFGTPAGVVLSPRGAALLGRAAVDLPVREG